MVKGGQRARGGRHGRRQAEFQPDSVQNIPKVHFSRCQAGLSLASGRLRIPPRGSNKPRPSLQGQVQELTGRAEFYLICWADNAFIFNFHYHSKTVMLFKNFERQASESPFSTLESLPAHDLEVCPQDSFRLAPPRLAPVRRAEELERSVLGWFAARGVASGHPEQLREEFNGLQIRKVISSQESAAKPLSGLLERRLSRKLTLKL